MAFRVMLDGSIETDTASEALAVLALINAGRNGYQHAVRPESPRAELLAQRGKSKDQFESLRRSIAFLEAIKGAGADGIPSASLGQALNLKDVRGIGGYSGALSKALAEQGLKIDKVVRKSRGSDSTWTWYAERDVDVALKALRARAGATAG
jgi:hypothetical protein